MPADQMALVWKRHGDNWRGFDAGRYLVASVVRYDAPVPHWSASVRLARVDGRYETAEAAITAAEQAAGGSPSTPAGDGAN